MSGAQSGRDALGKFSPSSPYFQCVEKLYPEGTDQTAAFSANSLALSSDLLTCAAFQSASSLLPSTPLPHLFQDTFAPATLWLFKGHIAESMQSRWLKKHWAHDIEAARYPLIHELTEHRLASELTGEKLLKRIRFISEQLQPTEDGQGGEKSVPPSAQHRMRLKLQEAKSLVENYEQNFQNLNKWATQDGRDKAISREAALDIAFQLARAQETLDSAATEEKAASGRRLLWDTHQRRFAVPDTGPELKFGMAVLDLNVTAPNSVDRVLGDLVLETSFQVLKDFFKDSVVTRGTRTNFRIVNPNGSRLSQEQLLELEREIYSRIRSQVEKSKNRKWKKFVEKYRIDLSAGYEEVRFEMEDIRKNARGEYELATVVELLEKIDHAFRIASARSQEVTGRLKETKTLREAAQAPRLNHGQFPIPDLNGIPEGRFFEPLERATPGAEAVRLIHNLKRIFENFQAAKEGLANLEWMIPEAISDSSKRKAAGEKASEVLKLLEENRGQFHEIYYDVTHDLRMPRLLERPYAAERVDAVVGETGGARLLFLELGKFYNFTRNWYGGNQDKYLHELIYDFYRSLSKRGLGLVHPGNEAPIFAKGEQLALDPKSGQYFSSLELPDSSPEVQLLTHSRSGKPVASEMIVGMREGDEIGFIVADRDAKGRFVTDGMIRRVFADFDAVVREKYGSMFFDDIEKVGPDKIRMPKWQLREYRASKSNGKNGGKYVVTQNNLLKLESEATKNFTGLVMDYVGVTGEDVDPRVAKENAKVIVGRRPRWRYFEKGRPSPGMEIYYGEPVFFVPGETNSDFQSVPEEFIKHHPEVSGKPILIKLQTNLTAGYVSVDLTRGADLEAAWHLANNRSKESKKKKGDPIFTRLNGVERKKPGGYEYDRTRSATRTEELSNLFGKYAQKEAPSGEPRLSPELKEWIRSHQHTVMEAINPRHPRGFESSLASLIEKTVGNEAQRAKMLGELKTLSQPGAELVQLRDGLIAVQVLEREGLSLQLKPLVPGLWQALSAAQGILEGGPIKKKLSKAKTTMVKLYVQQTGDLPPPDVLAEVRKYVDPLSVFIPEEVYALARHHQISPEKVPYFVAGLKADEIRKRGQAAFQSLTYEDLNRLVESPQGQAFLRDPKNALLLQDTLSARLAYQGVPLLAAMLSIFPAEMMAGYLAEKIGKGTGLKPKQILELKFGMTLYFAHTFNITASGAWEVLLNRAGAASALSAAIDSQVNIGVFRSAKVAGQPFLQLGVRSGGGLTQALADGVLEKWGISSFSKMGAGGVAWHLAKGVPRVPLQMLKTMGPGYLASRLFDLGAARLVGPDHPLRKYGGFVAFFLPDILRVALGSSRIAASPLLRTAGGVFTRAGNRVLLVAICDFIFSKAVIKNDYERSVHKRVADRVYDEEVYRLSLEKDWWVLPAVAKLARAGTRALAPNAIDWSLAISNPDLETKIMGEDLDASRKMTQFWKDGLAKLLLSPGAFSPEDENSYRKLDWGILTRPVEMGELENRVLEKIENCTTPVNEDALNFVPQEKMEGVLQKVFAYQLQQAARLILAIDQEENRWAREVFNEDGTLKTDKTSRLLEILHPPKKDEPSPEAKLLASRKILVGLSLLDGQGLFHRASISKSARSAGLVERNGAWIPSEEFSAAFALYAAQAAESKDVKAQEKLAGHLGKLTSDYLKAPEALKPKYLALLNCLAVKPESTKPNGSE